MSCMHVAEALNHCSSATLCQNHHHPIYLTIASCEYLLDYRTECGSSAWQQRVAARGSGSAHR